MGALEWMTKSMKKTKAKVKNKQRERPYHYKGCGLNNVFLYGGIREIQTPRGKLVQIEDLKGLHREIGRSLVHEKKISRARNLNSFAMR